jgi:hypothetical protein
MRIADDALAAEAAAQRNGNDSEQPRPPLFGRIR